MASLNYIRSQNIWPGKCTSCKNNQHHLRFLALHTSSTQPGVERRSTGRSKAPSFSLYSPSELHPWRRSPQGKRRAARASPVRTRWKVESGKGQIQPPGRLDCRQDRGSFSILTALFTHGCRATKRAGAGCPCAGYGIDWTNWSSWALAHSDSY